MKRIAYLFLVLSLLIVIGRASVPVSTTVTISFDMIIDTNQLGGLTPSQYGSNFTALLWSTTNINTPTNQYQYYGATPAGPLIASQGPPGTLWTNQLATDTSTRFYLLQWSNVVNGGVGPFSVVAPYYQNPSGFISVHN